MFCSKCGSERSDDDRFCAKCGAPSVDADVSNTATQVGTAQNYDKIGGWLILIAIGLFVTPFILAYGIFDSLSLLGEGGLEAMNSVVPGLGTAILFELIIDAVLFFGVLYLIFLFREKKRNFPKHYIWYLGASVVYLVLDFILVSTLSATDPEVQAVLDASLEEYAGSMVGITIGSAIWIAYMLKSKRVAGTFIK